MKKSLYICAVFILVSSFNVSAGGWTGKQTVHRVYPATASVYIQTTPSSAQINPDGCSSVTSYAMNSEGLLFDEQYKAVLTGLVSGKLVSFYLDGCKGSYPMITKLVVYN